MIMDAGHGGMLSYGLANLAKIVAADKEERLLIYENKRGETVEERAE